MSKLVFLLDGDQDLHFKGGEASFPEVIGGVSEIDQRWSVSGARAILYARAESLII